MARLDFRYYLRNWQSNWPDKLIMDVWSLDTRKHT